MFKYGIAEDASGRKHVILICVAWLFPASFWRGSDCLKIWFHNVRPFGFLCSLVSPANSCQRYATRRDIPYVQGWLYCFRNSAPIFSPTAILKDLDKYSKTGQLPPSILTNSLVLPILVKCVPHEGIFHMGRIDYIVSEIQQLVKILGGSWTVWFAKRMVMNAQSSQYVSRIRW